MKNKRLTIKEFSELYCVKWRSVYRWVNSNELDSEKNNGIIQIPLTKKNKEFIKGKK